MTVPRFRSSRLLTVALVAVVVAGCATLPRAPRRPIESEARRALAALRERAVEMPTVRTLAHLDVQRGSRRQRVQGILLARPPSSVRFEALSPLGPPLLLATIHEGRLTAYDATTNEATVGPATAETAARVLNLPFEPEDLVAILAGHAVVPGDVRSAELLPPDETGPSLEIVGPVNRRRIWLDPDTGLVRQFELTGGRAEARVRYDREPDGTIRGFTLSALLGLVTASVRYRRPEFGLDLPDDVFVFAPPATAKVQQIR